MSASFYIACDFHRVKGPEVVFRKWHDYVGGDVFHEDEHYEAFCAFCQEHHHCLEGGSVTVIPEWEAEDGFQDFKDVRIER